MSKNNSKLWILFLAKKLKQNDSPKASESCLVTNGPLKALPLGLSQWRP